MRTTVTLNDALLDELKCKAAEREITLSQLIEDLLHLGLAREAEAEAMDPELLDIITFGKGGSGPLQSIDKTSEQIGREDEERYGQDGSTLSATA